MNKIPVALLVLTAGVLLAQPPSGDPADDPTAEIHALHDTGQTRLAAGDADGALAAFRASLKMAREIGEKPAIARNLLEIGRIHASAGRLSAATETLRRARVAAEEIDARATLGQIEAARAESLTAMGRLAEAAEARRRSESLAAEIEAQENASRLAELEAALDAERQRFEAESGEQRQTIAEQRREIEALAARLPLFQGLAAAGGVALLLLLPGLIARRRLKRRTREEIALRDQELEHSSARLESLAQELASTTTRLEAITAERDAAAAELASTAAERDETRSELERTTFALNRAKSELERTASQLERTTAELAETSALRDQSAVQLAETSAQLQHAESTLEKAFDKLEQTVDELQQLKRSYRSDIAELGDRNAAARARLDEMERFNSTVAQHLKILLVAVRSSLGALEQDAEAGDVQQLQRDVDRTREAVGRTVRLLDKLLRLLLVGRMIHAPERVQMGELAFEAVGQVAGLVANRRVEIMVAPDLPAVIGDRAQLLEVLKSLLENGGKFMGTQPTPRLEVGWRSGESNEPATHVFYVRDNGIGIPAAEQNRVWNLFEQLDPEIEGVGIGLALVKRIVEAHGGRVWVESEGEASGSTFCFTVPPPDAAH